MANINFNLFVLDGDNCPTLQLIDTTNLSITVNGGSPILADNSIVEVIPQDTTVTLEISKTGYDGYVNSIDVAASDVTYYVVLSATVPTDFITITQTCHSYEINNGGTSSAEDVTYTVTDLDNNVIDDNLNIELEFDTSKTITFTSDGVYIIIVKDVSDAVIRRYVILDICTILSCFTNRILDILCKDCGCNDDCTDYCKKDYDMKRIFLLGFDLLNRINREYRLNSYYTTIDDAKILELRTAEDIITKLLAYCSECGSTDINFSTVLSNNSSNSDCGCS